jgi:hypothetical protein
MRYATRLIPTALLVIAATAVGIACTGGSGESDGATQAALKPGGNNPPGNNGTVKIQELGDPLEIPDNDPHVGCKFQIEFRGFDEGVGNATWALVGQAPTGKDTPVLDGSVDIGQDPAGGANDVDAVVPVDLTDKLGVLGAPHPQQGFHLKLTVHAPGSQGADTKHKVFWVQGCTTPPPPDAGQPDAPPPPTCGDGIVNGSEQCDEGEGNGEPGSGCDRYCCPVTPPPPPDGGQTW